MCKRQVHGQCLQAVEAMATASGWRWPVRTPPKPSSTDNVAEGAGPEKSAELENNLMDEDAARVRRAHEQHADAVWPLRRTCDLTIALTGDLLDELARGCSQPWFQKLVHVHAEACGRDRARFLQELPDITFEVQRPVLENWGFDGNEQGLFDVTSILREHFEGEGKRAPPWLRAKRDRYLALLSGAVDPAAQSG
eukprot:NODE_15103_length_1068_cov_3.128587.p2 GENE.NODE_15103_length_1068_cov_3.128587~~NODE_15103_length_1068_cov_3.128587.p2  ORF type:complete len:195 (+),score=28.52 NODE_15103_length_1068_cov_3.128587:145-729(+)